MYCGAYGLQILDTGLWMLDGTMIFDFSIFTAKDVISHFFIPASGIKYPASLRIEQ
jgi:hypothetical protein